MTPKVIAWDRDYATADELELADRIRSGKLTGVELVRREGEEVWQPLFESHVFRREVPNAGDPWEAARFATLVASYSVTRPGLEGIPSPEEIQACMMEVLY